MASETTALATATQRIALCDGWTFTKEGTTKQVVLPHTWNAQDGQDGGGDYYRGTCTYTRELVWPEGALEDSRVWLEFTGVEMTAVVKIDGRRVASHEDGFSTFRVDLTDALSDRRTHELSVDVSNARSESVYPQQADFTFYGGIYRPVYLVVAPALHFALGRDGGPGILAAAVVDLDRRSAVVDVDAWVADGAEDGEDAPREASGNVRFTIAGANDFPGAEPVTVAVAAISDGHAHARMVINDVHLWDGLKDPYLYYLTAELYPGGRDGISADARPVDVQTQRFGCREMRVDPQKGFFLNGRPYPLRGVSRHQDWKGVGNALQPWMHEKDIELIREIGANAVRLAHYQHSQEFYDLCDEEGLIVWAEIPFISMYMPEGRANTLLQMRELITQNRHHASIFCWALSNEISTASVVDDELIDNHKELDALAKKLDPTRPTAIANAFMLETDSPLHDVADLSTYNLYYGWYMGELADNEKFLDAEHARFPQRRIGLTEYGADANIAFQTSRPSVGDYSEQYQCVYHEHMIQLLAQRPWLWCGFVWNMFDFAADGRDEGGSHGINQKGLVTFDRKTKKDAFYLYKAWWSDQPFVHVCGSRFIDRAEAQTEVVVYSNQKHVDLFVDGRRVAGQDGSHVFRFTVGLGKVGSEHVIGARSGTLFEAITVRHADKYNPAYSLSGAAPVTNWFNGIVINQRFFSINDRLGDLQADPRAGALLAKLMTSVRPKGTGEHNELAEKAKANKNLQAIIARQQLSSLLSRVGVTDPKVLKKLNDALQQIPKDTGAAGADAQAAAAAGQEGAAR